eukprot:15452334-Alexandrium_andersonii.AAC.1
MSALATLCQRSRLRMSPTRTSSAPAIPVAHVERRTCTRRWSTSTASGTLSCKSAAAVAKGPNMPAHSSATAGVWPDPAPQRLPVPAQKCSS